MMEKELSKFGLGHYESKALISLFSKRLNLRDLSKRSGIPFGKVYTVVKSLKEKGFIKETNSRPKLIYIENASEVISKIIKRKEQDDEEIIEKLKNLATEADKAKGNRTRFLEVGTTSEDNTEIQLRTFNEAEKEVLQIINIHHKPKSNRKSKTLWEMAIVKAVERGVVFKSIYPQNSDLPHILSQLRKRCPERFQVRRLDTDFVRCDIIDADKVLIKIVHDDPLQFGGALFIENKKMAENLSSIFYELWENAEK